MLMRRAWMAAMLSAAAPGVQAQEDAASNGGGQAAWPVFAARFLTPEGRIVDTGNEGVSHTEGQGWGLLFAATYGNLATFQRILNWTTATLGRPNDALHAWRYVPGATQPVQDLNNATDGDLFIAFALDRAATRWQRPELRWRAHKIARSVMDMLVRRVGGRTVLLPGAEGFDTPGGMVLNPSYYAFPAIAALAQIEPSPLWRALLDDGVALLDKGRFGSWALPPDWVLALPDGTLRPAPNRPARFGYDAIRAPLYAAWGGHAMLREPAGRWLRHASPPPAWVDVTDGSVAGYAAGPGMLAALTVAAADPGANGSNAALAPIDDTMDYYTAALCLLSRVAADDIIAHRTAAGPR